MEIVLALIIGLAVGCVVFILGRAFVGSGRASDLMQHQPELSISASAGRPDTAGDAVKSIVDETETVRTAKPVPDRNVTTKKARKPPAARAQEGAAKTPRRRKTNKLTTSATEVGPPATAGPSLAAPAALDRRLS
jgi:hypothetical protein